VKSLILVTLFCWGLNAKDRRNGDLLQHAPPSQLSNPYVADEDARRAGAKLYERECAACHGRSGEGYGKAPPLSSPSVRRASPGALFWVLRNGSLKRGMPSFAHLPEARRWQIIAYLQDELQHKMSYKIRSPESR
jgi:mono/diheme cytochrome c family protein